MTASRDSGGPQGRPSSHGLPPLTEALTSLLRTLVVALFILTFLLQPFLIPSESMERTLLVGDFLLVNKQTFAPAGSAANPGRWLLPHRPVERGDIVVFHHSMPDYLIKRVVGLPGDRIRLDGQQVIVNGVSLQEPYAVFEPAPENQFRDNFPSKMYTDPNVDPTWWLALQHLTQNGDLVVPPDQFFVLGDNRNHSKDSRYWGLVPRDAIMARPIVIYFSLRRPSATDAAGGENDRLGHGTGLVARLTAFARWERIFQTVH
ncbi:MAG: signal peptidase I [Acidobacteriota bacterium]|nr:signal peptidase I [Acidobacteriota bacterium]